jgi:hypothetical protein
MFQRQLERLFGGSCDHPFEPMLKLAAAAEIDLARAADIVSTIPRRFGLATEQAADFESTPQAETSPQLRIVDAESFCGFNHLPRRKTPISRKIAEHVLNAFMYSGVHHCSILLLTRFNTSHITKLCLHG